MAKKKRSLKALKRDLDAAFSKFIRQRDAKADGYVACITCGRISHWKEGHAGHFIKRQYLATRYDPRNCHFQDAYCNTYRGGALVEYTLYMQKRYGQSVVDELLQAKHKTVKMTREDYETLLEKYS
jgi:NinG protein